MSTTDLESTPTRSLGLRAGDWVEVRSVQEILATLDERGNLDALPFMPEMLAFCGRRFRVSKSAHKTCDTISTYRNRRMTNAVHLEGLRCDGSGHDGCQAACLLFWKEAWLRPVSGPKGESEPVAGPRKQDGTGTARCTVETLAGAVRADTAQAGEKIYSCQATELVRATAPLDWWDPRQYIKDLVSGNVGLWDFIRFGALGTFKAVMRLHWRLNWFDVRGSAGAKTPSLQLKLQPGERVRVRSRREILSTCDAEGKNRGLSFDVEMAPFCGRTLRVLTRVDKIINDKNGKMIHLPNDCIILDGATCSGNLSRRRMFCPRAIYPYWREIWLKRVD